LTFLIRVAATLAICLCGSAIAHESDEAETSGNVLDRRFVFGIAVGAERFNTNIKITDPQSGNSTFIDAEGNFGLPQTNTVPIVYGAFRINEKHGLGFYAFKINRQGSLINIDKDYGDLAVNGSISFTDKTSFSYLSYHYRLFDDKRVKIRALFGIYALDLSMELNASGQITVGGDPVLSGEYTESINQFAPLPLIGLDFWSTIGEKWAIGAKFAAIGGTYDDVSALVVDVSMRSRYQMTEHVGLIAGFNYLSADVKITGSKSINDIRYGYDGIFLGLDFNF